MKILLSPAKSLDLESDYSNKYSTELIFRKESDILNSKLAELNRSQLKDLMSISDKIAALNIDRYAAKKAKDNSNDRPAVFMFNGDVYDGLNINSISENHYKFLQNTIRILSGMYGILRPFDVMSPYRLEMGTKLKINDSNNLYDFWKSKLTGYLNTELSNDEIVINLASQEYFKAINHKQLKSDVISPVFKDFKNGKYKVISFYAKKARGVMAKYLVETEAERLEDIMAFNLEGYQFNPNETQKANEPVFTRSS
ncbi:peroxide stress protein YaaA [Psychroflexus sp. ALD_RP9]|uniref:peroxide stress protein YaaA n=1 Tax=Psychroflexus sp. ALD_RP9 TaxID=2777186 RepID=UPI001A8C468A|nr:peroxide stress protein YaaA [Psychroflexus sp. ALD_RP9]QSS97042.1 peroxide stress protein YaaA [Psychroflexus sp. ALD_RP9]